MVCHFTIPYGHVRMLHSGYRILGGLRFVAMFLCAMRSSPKPALCFRFFFSAYFFCFGGFGYVSHVVFVYGLVGVFGSDCAEFFGSGVEPVKFHFLLPIR